MRSVRDTDAPSQLGRLLDAVAGGEEIVITRDEKPVARLLPARSSLRDLQPASVGHILQPIDVDDDLLDEMRKE